MSEGTCRTCGPRWAEGRLEVELWRRAFAVAVVNEDRSAGPDDGTFLTGSVSVCRCPLKALGERREGTAPPPRAYGAQGVLVQD